MGYKDKQKMAEYVNRYNREKYDRIGLMAPKADGEKIRAAAANAGKSLNDYILTAIHEKMEHDAAK